ncbi:hypothetical protein [Mangrovicella endophytica]|uniref:hypothetical protein n=1 Tax=Mangrovicella endophytica TaxID=2066697 RepID=UPI000C9E9EDE|nr:hypothetical protein [Mangrovicella endophytica]
MRLIFHVGAHKTGTSAIQAFLSKNRDELAVQGIWYAPSAGHMNHSPLAQDFQRSGQAGSAAIHECIEDGERAGCSTILFSSECFSEHPFREVAFQESLRGLETLVIGYVRRPDDIVISAYNEIVRDSTHRWTDSLDAKLPYDPTYISIFKRWIGPGKPWRFIVAPYDQDQWVGGTLLSDFSVMIGADPSSMKQEIDRDAANRSLPAPLIEVMRAINRIGLSDDHHRAVVQAMYRASEDSPHLYEVDDGISDARRAAYRKSFESVAVLFRPHYRPGFNEDFMIA